MRPSTRCRHSSPLQVGVLPNETYISDGSGLRGKTFVALHAAVKLLALHGAISTTSSQYFDSLPVSGIDGTLAHDPLSDVRKEG